MLVPGLGESARQVPEIRRDVVDEDFSGSGSKTIAGAQAPGLCQLGNTQGADDMLTSHCSGSFQRHNCLASARSSRR